MTLKNLEIFVTVVNCGSVTKASKELFMAQPRVSLVIKELEKHYQTLLFERLNKRLYLTEDGKKLYEYAINILDMAKSAEADLNKNKEKHLRVGASITVASDFLNILINDFMKDNQDYQIIIVVKNSKDVINDLKNNMIDIALVETEDFDDRIDSKAFLEDKLVFVSSIDSKLSNQSLSKEEFNNLNFLLREDGSSQRSIFNKIIKEHALTPKIIMESVSNAAIFKMLDSNLGVSLMPKRLVGNNLGCFYYENLEIYREFSYLMLKQKRKSNAIQNFIKVIENSTLI